MQPPETLRDALGQVIAHERAQWRRERELIEAESRAAIADLRAQIVALRAEVKDEVAARLATLRDGRDGAPGPQGPQGEPGRDGADGRDGAPGPQGPQGEAGRDGVDGRDGAPGLQGRQGEPGHDGRDGKDGRDGADGAPGERGPEGPAGKLPLARAWAERVYYAGDVVTHSGATWQAAQDTGNAPPHADWICLAEAGRAGSNGRAMTIRGTWSKTEQYSSLDVVALSGASFVARRDDPGPCPGEGWQMIAAQGKRGGQGEPGRPGVRGEPGPAGARVARMEIDGEGMMSLANSDGTRVELDLYPLLNKIARR